MTQIDISINGREYQIACDDGQEEHITQLAAYVEHKVAELVASVGQVGDARLLVMASLLLADELSEAYATIDETEEVGRGTKGEAQGTEARAATALAALAERIEGIAARLEAA